MRKYKNRPKRGRYLKKILIKSLLYREYITNKLSSHKIAKKYNCSKNTILKYLKQYDIPWRDKSKSQIGKIVSLETRKNQSLAQIGKISPFKGIKNRYTPQVLKKITEANIRNARKGKDHHNWINGISKTGYPHYFNDELKSKIRLRDNFICQNCEIDEGSHYRGQRQINLTVHHIDYNKENCEENNLITLCFKCNI